MKWWQKTVVYEVYPKSFNDTTGSGTGDIPGIIEKLDYLKTLGVGAIWLTPVCRSPMVDNGYDISDYFSIDPSWGTMEDMDRLFAEAEKRGIKIVIDLVFNHTSDQNPWFLESKKSRTNEKSDWYIWKDAKPDGSAPTNWRGIFGGSAWTWCEQRQQYYLHTFAEQQPDINWANPDVRQALYDAANFWIDRGAGGFRIDAIVYIKKPDVFEDGPADGEDGMVSVHAMTCNQPGILDYLHEMKEKVMDGHDIFTVGEANGISPDELDQWVGENGVFDMLFEFSHTNLEFDGVEIWCKPKKWVIADLKKALRNSQAATKDNGWYPAFFENHDLRRSVTHYFPENTDRTMASKAIGTILYTLRGTPFLYQGQELAYVNVDWDDICVYDDISTKGQYEIARNEECTHEEAMKFIQFFSRDSARTPMQWNTDVNAGFSNGKPWLPVHDDYRIYNVETESRDPDSSLSWYRALAKLRAENDVLVSGDFEELIPCHPSVFAFRRTNDSQKAVILVNLSVQEQSYDAAAEENLDVRMCSAKAHIPGKLQPLEAVILL